MSGADKTTMVTGQTETDAKHMTLDTLALGSTATILSVDCEEKQLRQHILDMGLTPGVDVAMIKAAPMGDPLQLRLRGYELTIRKADAAQISIEHIREYAAPKTAEQSKQGHRKVELTSQTPHPALGEFDGTQDDQDSKSGYKPRSSSHMIP